MFRGILKTKKRVLQSAIKYYNEIRNSESYKFLNKETEIDKDIRMKLSAKMSFFELKIKFNEKWDIEYIQVRLILLICLSFWQ